MKRRYIDRDSEGTIAGTYARPQYDGQESLPEDDPEVTAWQSRPVTQKDETEAKIQAEIRAMAIERLKTRGELPEDFVDKNQW